MGVGESIKNMKVAELRTLARDLDIEFTGGKKADIIEAINNAAANKLDTCTVSELRSLAKDLSINLKGIKKKMEIAETIHSSLTGESLVSLLGQADEPEPAPEPVKEESLEEIGEELVDIEKDVEVVLDDVKKMPASDMADIYEIDNKLAEIVKVNLDYSDVGSMLDVGRIKFHDKNFVESLGILQEAIQISEKFFDQYQDVAYAFTILASELILVECREAESNDESAADALIDAKRAFPVGGVRRKAAVELLNGIANRAYREEVALQEKLMGEREGLIKAMKVQGVDVFNAERYLHRAREAYLVGELSSSMSYIEKAMQNAEESKEVWIKDIEKDVPRVDGIIKQASDLGADTSEAEKHLTQAKVALDNKDYSLCSELTKLSERKAMESQQSQIQKAAQLEQEKLGDAQKILATIGPLVQEAQLYRMDVQEINSLIQAARTALQDSDYVNAMTHARQAEGQTKYLSTQLEAERQKILAAGGEFKQCSMCNSQSVKIFDSGWARCMNCGQTFEVVGDDKRKKKWGLFGK